MEFISADRYSKPVEGRGLLEHVEAAEVVVQLLPVAGGMLPVAIRQSPDWQIVSVSFCPNLFYLVQCV